MNVKLLNVVLLGLIMVLGFISLLIGPADIPISQAIKSLLNGEGEVFVVVMREIRLPRAALSIMIGFALGISGAAMQGFLRNPLAEPGVIGISSASALGAIIALQTGFAIEGAQLNEALSLGNFSPIFALPIAAMLGALSAALIVLLFGQARKSERLILIGIGISSIAGALSTLVLNLSPNPFAAMEIIFWMMGSVADRSMLHVWMALPFITIGSFILLSLGKSLDALSLGEDTGQSLGINLGRLSAMLIFAVAMMVGASVAVAGAIGFVGLVIPHMLRPIIGSKPSKILLSSGLGGAALLTAADILTRVITPERDLKLGVITALIGAPIFLHLVFKSSKDQA